MQIQQIIENAFTAAKQTQLKHQSELEINRDRSQHWVESLAKAFRIAHKEEKSIRVFSKYHKDNKLDFGLNELLFDISVCQINYIKSPHHNRQLAYIKKALWLIESEMAKDTRQFLYDFNKLVIGDAENKLFIGPHSKIIIDFLPELTKAAKHCSGNLFLGLIPHPIDWDNKELKPQLWEFNGKVFQDL